MKLADRIAALSPTRRYTIVIGAILVVAFALRVAVRALAGAQGFWTNSYILFFTLARQLAAGHGYAFPGHPPTAFRVPLYPIFLALVTQGRQDFGAILVAQALISTGTVACVAGLALLWFGRHTAVIAAVIAALYPYYLWHDTALQETGLVTFLGAAAMLLLVVAQRSRSIAPALGAGLLLGLAILTRATLLPFALCAVAWLMLQGPCDAPPSRRWRSAGLCLVALCATLSPWLIRAHALTGRYSLGTEFGAAVFGGNNPATFVYYPQRSIDLSRVLAVRSMPAADRARVQALRGDEAAQSDWYLHRALSYIAADPARFLVGAVRKNVAAFGVMPSPRHDAPADLVEACSYGPILLLGLIGLWSTRRRWREVLPVHAHFVCFAGVTGVIWGHSSHRAFLDAYLIVFAASTIVALSQHIRRRRGVNLRGEVERNRIAGP